MFSKCHCKIKVGIVCIWERMFYYIYIKTNAIEHDKIIFVFLGSLLEYFITPEIRTVSLSWSQITQKTSRLVYVCNRLRFQPFCECRYPVMPKQAVQLLYDYVRVPLYIPVSTTTWDCRVWYGTFIVLLLLSVFTAFTPEKQPPHTVHHNEEVKPYLNHLHD